MPWPKALGLFANAKAMFGGTAEYVALSFKNYGKESPLFTDVSTMAAVAFAASLRMHAPYKCGSLDGNGRMSG